MTLPSPPFVPRILIVDDYAETARVLGQILRIFGFETFLAHDGESAVARANELAPHAVVLDLVLPDIDGYEVARRLRASERTRDAVIVALTGYPLDEAADAAEHADFDYHLVKPIAPSVLRDLLLTAFAEVSRSTPDSDASREPPATGAVVS